MGKRKISGFVVLICLFAAILGGCAKANQTNITANKKQIGQMQLEYASQFCVKYYEDGYASIQVADGNNYVLVPEGGEDIVLDEPDPTYIHLPCKRIYLAASSAMDLFREMDSLGEIVACSTKASDYSMDEVVRLIEEDKISYVGKYSSPDYESLLELGSDIAIESTMIYHTPKIKEELEALKIPVFVERSSYEKEPLGRLEWIKLYGLLMEKEALANQLYENQVQKVLSCMDVNSSDQGTDKNISVVFFYISSNGYVNVRKPGDYVSKMIELSGGEYALKSLEVEEENALSTVNISWEDFYMYARNAVLLIYNGTIDGGISSIDALVRENEMFSDFEAVKKGHVFCAMNNMYQESSKLGDIIVELTGAIRYVRNQEGSDFEGRYIKLLK